MSLLDAHYGFHTPALWVYLPTIGQPKKSTITPAQAPTLGTCLATSVMYGLGPILAMSADVSRYICIEVCINVSLGDGVGESRLTTLSPFSTRYSCS